MSTDDRQENEKIFHYEEGVPVFDDRLHEVERKQAEAETREETYRNQQLTINKWVMRFTGALVILAAITGVVNGIYTYITKISAESAKTSAETAKRAADTAHDTLIEIQKSGTDTHDLAKQAERQTILSSQLARNAANANRLASQIIQVSQSAYVTLGRKDGVVAEFKNSGDLQARDGVVIYFQNSGHIPAKFNWGLTQWFTQPQAQLPSPTPFVPMSRTRNKKTGAFLKMEVLMELSAAILYAKWRLATCHQCLLTRCSK